MNRIYAFFEPDQFIHFIKCLLSNPKHFEYKTIHSHFSIKSNVSTEDLQKEIYDWIGRRIES